MAQHFHSLEILNWDFIQNALGQRAMSPIGQVRCRTHGPLESPAMARLLQRKTAEALDLFKIKHPLQSLVSGTSDPSDCFERASRDALLTPTEIFICGHFMQTVGLIAAETKSLKDSCPLLAQDFQFAPGTPPVCDQISRSVSSEGEILDTASNELGAFRKKRSEMRASFENKLQTKVKEWHKQGLLQDQFYDLVDGRYVVPVKAEFQSKLDGSLVGHSSSGSSVFVEPQELTVSSNALKSIDLAIRAEELRILREFSSKIGFLWSTYQIWIEPIAEFDLIFAAATLANDFELKAPKHSESERLELKNVFHPQLLSQGTDPIKNSFSLGGHQNPKCCLLISGPNTGGKTVLIKAAALSALLQQSGLYVPTSDDSEIPYYKKIYALIGDEQSIASGLSSFSAQIQELRKVLSDQEGPNLIVIDEILSSTDPEEASALAQAFLEDCIARGHHVIVTSHFSELSARMKSHPKAIVGAMEFFAGRPTFCLRLDELGASHALEVADRLGMPKNILSRAKELLSKGKIDYQAALSELRKKELDLEKKHRSEIEQFEATKKSMRQKVESFLADAENKLRSAIDEALRAISLEKAKKGPVNSAKLRSHMDTLSETKHQSLIDQADTALKNEFGSTESLGARKEKNQIAPGAQVRMKDNRHLRGRVLSVNTEAGIATVQFGILRMDRSLSELELTTHEKSQFHRSKGIQIESPTGNDIFLQGLSKKLDLRGMRKEEALSKAEKFLDSALRSGLVSATIITGHGTGAIKSALQELLKELPYVISVKSEREGDDGAVIIELG